MTYKLVGNFVSAGRSYEFAVIRVSNIRASVVDRLYSFDVAIYEDGNAVEPLETAGYLSFDIPNDTADDELELRAIKIAAAVFMPDGLLSDSEDK